MAWEKRLMAAVLALGVGQAIGAPIVLLSDTFSDGERVTQSLPSSAAFTLGRVGTVAVTDKLSMTPTTVGTNFIATAYFAEAGAPIVLGVGDSLKLSFSFSGSVMGTNSNGFRFALVNSGGSHLTTDIADTGSSTTYSFANYRGYGATFGFRNSAVAGQFSTTERTGTSDMLITTTNGFAPLGLTGSGTQSFVNTAQTAELTLTRTGVGTMLVASTVGSASVSASDTSGIFTGFDGLGIFSDGNNGTITLDDVTVTYTALPEPGAAAVGVCGAMLMLGRQRK